MISRLATVQTLDASPKQYPQPTTQKAPVIANESFAFLVARGGIEPPTQGFSIPLSITSTEDAASCAMRRNHADTD